MRRKPVLGSFSRALRSCCAAASLLLPAFSLAALPCAAFAQDEDENTRVMWQIRYDASLSKSKIEEVQNTLLSTLARGRERHFATDAIIQQKLKTEGLQMPSCFEDGSPCASGSAFLLDVHQVDVYVDALFSWKNNEWVIDLKLYKRLSASSSPITQHGKNLTTLLNNVVGALFILESSIDVTSPLPDVEVYLNRKLIGTTPLSMKINEGAQTITFKKEGYFPATWEFTAKKGVIHAHEVQLQPETTPFTVYASDPDADVFIDDVKWSKIAETKEILPGEHRIRIESKRYEDYEQELTIYSGYPQTMTVSMYPNPRDPLEVRHDNISRYRFSATAGYHFGLTKFSMNDIQVKLKQRKFDGTSGYHLVNPGGRSGNENEDWADTSFHGLTMAFNYENEYWGITIARLDLMGSAIDSAFGLYAQSDSGIKEKSYSATADGATLITFYPAQLKAHYTFWIMQAELVAGLGLSWMQLRAKEDTTGLDLKFDRTSFSANFDLALKCFFSEESFAMLSYGLQVDVETSRDTSLRHGLTIAVGLQIPLLMRDKNLNLDDPFTDVADADPESTQSVLSTHQNNTNYENIVQEFSGSTSLDEQAPALIQNNDPATPETDQSNQIIDAPIVNDEDSPISSNDASTMEVYRG